MLNKRFFILQKWSSHCYLWITIGLFLIAFQSVLANETQIRIAWDPNHESDLAGYRVYYGINPNPKTYATPIRLEIGKDLNFDTNPNITITGLTPGTGYHIVVTAFDQSNNESGPSNEVNVFPSGSF